MPEALSEDDLLAMRERDSSSADGLAVPDYHCEEDRHRLLDEVNRLRGVVQRLASAQPLARQEGRPWESA